MKKQIEITKKSIGTYSVNDRDDIEVMDAVKMIATYEGQFAGWAVLGINSLGLICAEILIETDYRNLGIATAIYDEAEKLFSQPVVPSPGRSIQADLFWIRRIIKEGDIEKIPNFIDLSYFDDEELEDLGLSSNDITNLRA